MITKKKNLILITVVVLIIILLAWSPWLNDYIAAANIETNLRNDIGNCNFYPQVVDWKYSIYPQKTLFGYIDKIKINCDPNLNPIYDKEITYYMSPFGTVHRLS